MKAMEAGYGVGAGALGIAKVTYNRFFNGKQRPNTQACGPTWPTEAAQSGRIQLAANVPLATERNEAGQKPLGAVNWSNAAHVRLMDLDAEQVRLIPAFSTNRPETAANWRCGKCA